MLKPRQKALAQLMVAEPQLTKAQLAERIGCAESSIYNWQQLAEFREYEHELCEKKFRSLEKIAIQKLMENITNGNQKAIQYALDYIGYKATQELDVNSNTISINILGDEDDKP